jgi:hypothetical protein
MKIIWVIKEISVKGYYRKDGSWVCPHKRTLKLKPKDVKIKINKKVYDNPEQLELPFPES